ncbi:type I secretion outer membrane protein, TolC family [Burkholderia sp. Ch1-1]|nr:type I secretion outer membrane protein, TolC family [Burkholderia sp. Ch1-1]
MTRRISKAALTQCALIAASMLGGTASATDLLSVWQDAQEADPGFAAARAQQRASDEALPQARAALLPHMQAAVGTASNWGNGFSDQPSQQYTSNGYAASLVVPVFHWGDWQGLDIGKLKVARGDVAFEKARQSLMLQVARAYFDVLEAQDTLRFTQAHEASLDTQLKRAQAGFDAGSETVVDVDEARAAHDLARADQASARSDFQIRRARLDKLVGHPTAALAALPEGALLPAVANIDQWVSLAADQNLDVASGRIDSEIAHKETRQARAADLPTVDLVATFNHSSQASSRYMYAPAIGSNPGVTGGAGNSKVVGVQITIPIFAGGAVQSRKRETLALEDKAARELQSALENAELDARQKYLALMNGMDRIHALQSAVKSSRTSSGSARTAYEVGDRTSTDVVIAEDRQYASQTALSRARYDYLIQRLELAQIAGQLTDSELTDVNALLGEAKGN